LQGDNWRNIEMFRKMFSAIARLQKKELGKVAEV